MSGLGFLLFAENKRARRDTVMIHHARVVAIGAVVALLAGCSESPTNPAAKRTPSVPQLTSPVQEPGPKRDDTPWRRMTDAELAGRVAEAGGRVFIGFKDPGASAGV